MEYTFEEHVALIMKEHGVTESKAKMMAWLEGPRKKESNMKNDLEFMAMFHKRATALYDAFMDATGDEAESFRKQWCEADNTFYAFFGMTLFEANKYFLDN